MNKKGFTLVELLVTIAVFSIITGLSIPVLRMVQGTQSERKYSLYLDNVKYAAKVYVDSYSVDLFSGKDSGCTYIYYKDLKKYNMIKDIDISGTSCNSDYTVVKVVKYKEKYYYNPYIGCGDEKNGIVEEPSIFKPSKADISGICSYNSSAVIGFLSSPEKSEDITKKVFTPKIVLYSETGVKNTPPDIEYGFSYSNDLANLNIINNTWKKANFNIIKKSAQEELIRAAKPQYFKSINTFDTPSDITGDVYLIIKVNTLLDLNDETWKTINNDKDKYVVLGPYRVDNEAPKYMTSKIVSSVSKYNSTVPRTHFNVVDTRYSKEKDLKMCYTYDGEEACPKPTSAKSLASMTQYKKYVREQNLKKIGTTYDGKTHKIHVTVADAAGNYREKTFDYKVAQAYKLRFNPDGGKSCSPTSISQIEGHAWSESVSNESGFTVHKFCTTTKLGNTFGGWYTGRNGTGTQVKVTDKATKNLTVYPKWIPEKVKVTFTCAPGSGSGTETFTYGISNQKFSFKCPGRTGYTQTGWTISGSENYSLTNSVTDAWIHKYHNSGVTMKAKWSPITYTISYNLNGGSLSSTNPEKYNIETPTFTLKNPTKTGYNFAGWTGTGLSGATKTVTVNKGSTGNRSYTANYNAKTVAVTFNCNGGTGGGSSTYTYGASGQKFNKTCTKSGYTLAGWTFNDNGTTRTYTVNNAVTDGWINEHSPRITVTAKWTPITYTITYNLNGGTVSGNPSTYTIETATFTLKNPTKDGYNFAGWTGTGLSSATKTVTVNKGSTGNRTYTATWTSKTVTVTFNCNGGTGGGSSTYTYGTNGQKFNKTCSRVGYSIDGWMDKSTDTAKKYDLASGVSNDWINSHSPSTTVYAHWTVQTYTITYNLNGGTVSGNPTTYNVNTNSFTLKNPNKTGYNYAGWTGTGLSSATKTVTVNKGSTGNRTYTANYNAKTVTVTFNCGGGAGGGTSTYTYGTSGQKFNKTCTKSGYTIAGWTFNDNGTTRTYTINHVVTDAWINAHSPSATVYAKWTPVTYTITYKPSNTVNNPTSYNVNTNSFTLKNPTKDGYNFAGWTGTGLSSATKPVTVNKGSTGNRTYTENWTAKKVTVTFNCGGGTGGGTSTYTYGIANQKFNKTCTKSGYTLAGWTFNDNGTTRTYAINNAVTDAWINAHSPSATVYAKWTPVTYTITYNLNGGTVSGNPTSYNVNTNSFTLKNPSKTGNNFVGWTGTGLSSATKPVTVTKGSTGNRSYTANYNPKKVTVTFNCGGGTGGGTSTYTYGIANQRFNKTCTKSGYTLAGWTFNDNGTTRTYTINNAVTDAWINAHSPSATVNAQWTVQTYTITYNLNGGTVSGNPTSYNVNTNSFTLKNPTKDGYNFTGWTGTGLSGATKPVTITKGSTGNRSYTANYTGNTFKVKYIANGGSGAMADTTCTYGSNCTLRTNSFVKEGYELMGWAKSETGNVVYTDGASVRNALTSGTLTLYARWKSTNITFRVRLHSGESYEKTTVHNNSTNNWTTDSNGMMYINGTLYGASYARGTNTIVDLPNHDYSKFLKITKKGYGATWDKAWICESGCRRQGQTFSEGEVFTNLDDIVADDNLDGTIIVHVNWRAAATTIAFFVNGGTLTSSAVSPSNAAFHDQKYVESVGGIYLGVGHYYISDTGRIYKGDQNDIHHEIAKNGTLNKLMSYNDPSGVVITKPSGKKDPAVGHEWKASSGCKKSTYSQSKSYKASDFCTPGNSDCLCRLWVNWR